MAVSFQFNHPLERVVEHLHNPDFIVERCLAVGEKSAECDIEGSGEELVLTMRRVRVSDLPKMLAKVFNAEQETAMTETWRRNGDGWVGDLNIDVVGQPVTISAKFSLVPNGDGCRYEIDHSCKAKIPLVGGKVEKFVISQTSGGCTDELDYLNTKLG